MRHVELDRRVLGLQPVNNYVHVKTADLYRPNARLTPERQGYQVLTPFGKLGYSLKDLLGHFRRRSAAKNDPINAATFEFVELNDYIDWIRGYIVENKLPTNLWRL